MKLDFDLIRAIMIASVEKQMGGGDLTRDDFAKDDWENVAYQVMHLQHRGYIEAEYIPHVMENAPAEFMIKGLTFEGHSLLKLMQDEKLWQGTKEVIANSGQELGFDTIKEAVSVVIAKMLS